MRGVPLPYHVAMRSLPPSNSGATTPTESVFSSPSAGYISTVDSSSDLIPIEASREASRDCKVMVSYRDTSWQYRSPTDEHLHLSSLKTFPEYLENRQTNDIRPIESSSVIWLASSFLGHLLELGMPESVIRTVLHAFEKDFLCDNIDIHTVAAGLEPSAQTNLLRAYFAALKVTNQPSRGPNSALFAAAEEGYASVYAVFGGQGYVNASCLKDLSDLYSTYGPLLDEMIDVAAHGFERLISLPNTRNYFECNGFDIKRWLEKPETAPNSAYIASAPLSFPIIGLLSLSHYCITCKVLGKSPGELRDLLRGVTGHSQGVISAAAIACSESWETFYESAEFALEILFWIGFESHHGTPLSSLSSAAMKDSIDAGEGQLSPMLSIRGLNQKSVQELVAEMNCHLEEKEKVYIALVNSRDNLVVAGPPLSLRGINLRLRKLKAPGDLDQSRTLFKDRKPIVQHHFLPISAAFHTPYLEDTTTRILDALRFRRFPGNSLGTALFHTHTGEDLRNMGSHDIIEHLIRMVTTEVVDWPKACSLLEGTHLIDFGPGRIGGLVHQTTEGTGLRIIVASELASISRSLGVKSEIFSSKMPLSGPNWGELYKPILRRNSSGEVKLDTKMSRLFGLPPLMVGGMTPTTVPWDFVAAVTNAGYHIELAGGGYISANEFEVAIRKVSENVRASHGITCNLIYASPKAISWQIPLIRGLIRKGVPIDGLTIGAGVPSADIAREYIETLGLRHISFKPGSYDSILQVVSIAKAHPDFPIGLQWTGGRSGGHHSFEDFHAPILATYGRIRECSNIVLIAGGGFGDACDSYPYITGKWSCDLGYPSMPFDGILLGSRMMVAKEAHTSPQAKHLIVEAEGVNNSQWYKSYKQPAGGVITVTSEMGQPIHKLATRGVLLWHDLDQKIFSIKDQSKRLAELEKCKADIVERLRNDYQKPWFAVNSSGQTVDINDMTYSEVLERLVSLMYVRHQSRWIDSSYQRLILDWIVRTQERLVPVSEFKDEKGSGDPYEFITAFTACYPSAKTELLHPEDVSFFTGLCKRRGQKPVNFIPTLDENFEHWFKKDSLWQAEDIDAVFDQEAQRVCIIHGPVAARYSKVADETAQSILDGIIKSYIKMLGRDLYPYDTDIYSDTSSAPGMDLAKSYADELRPQAIYQIPSSGPIPDTHALITYLLGDTSGWAHACLADKMILQGQRRQQNPIRSAFTPHHGHRITVNFRASGEVASVILGTHSELSRDVLRMTSSDGTHVSVILFEPNPHGIEDVGIEFKFYYHHEMRGCRLSEVMERRNERIKAFYANLWLGEYPPALLTAGLDTEFLGEKITLSKKMVQDFMSVIGASDPCRSMEEYTDDVVPMDVCIAVTWNALIKPLLIPSVDGNLLKLLHRSNNFEYYPGVEPLRIGETLETTSYIGAVTNKPSGKLIEVIAQIKRGQIAAVKITSSFFIQDSMSDLGRTFRCIEEPEMELFVSSPKVQALLTSRRWFTLDNGTANIAGKTLLFKLTTRATYNSAQVTSLLVTGQVFSKCTTKSLEKIGRVYFNRGVLDGNPVMDFLIRHSSGVHEPKPLLKPGWNGDCSWKIQAPKRNAPYARVSKDTNPIHVSPVFSKYANLPGMVTHGMYTSAAVRRVIERTVAEADVTRFRKFAASFESMVMPGDELRVEMQHVAMVDGRMVIATQAYNYKTGDLVLKGEAEIEQAPTAYVFTGQGSQEKGMGMALYDSSPAAKTLWDRGDKYLLDIYGEMNLSSYWAL